MSTIQVRYNGSDITAKCVLGETTFTSQSNGTAGTCQIAIKDVAQAYTFQPGKTIELFIDGTREWDGYLVRQTYNYWFAGHDANCYPCPHVTPRKIVLHGVDRNILFSSRVMYDKANPKNAIAPVWPEGTLDSAVIAAHIGDYVDNLDGVNFSARVETVASPDPYVEFQVPGPTHPLGDLFANLAMAVGSVYYIDPDRYLVYTDVDTPDAPFGISDRPGAGEIGCRDLVILSDASHMVNDALIWGAGQGSNSVEFVRVEDAASIAAHGRWQNSGGYRTNLWKQESINRTANSIVYGSPSNKRGHKDDAVSVTCTVFEPGLRVGHKAHVSSDVFGFTDVIPIREMTMTFPTPTKVQYDLKLSHWIDKPWTIQEFWWPPRECTPVSCEVIGLPSGGEGDFPWLTQSQHPETNYVDGNRARMSLSGWKGNNSLALPFTMPIDIRVEGEVGRDLSHPADWNWGFDIRRETSPSWTIEISSRIAGRFDDYSEGSHIFRTTGPIDSVLSGTNEFNNGLSKRIVFRWQYDGVTLRVKMWHPLNPEPSGWTGVFSAGDLSEHPPEYFVVWASNQFRFEIDYIEVIEGLPCSPTVETFSRVVEDGWGISEICTSGEVHHVIEERPCIPIYTCGEVCVPPVLDHCGTDAGTAYCLYRASIPYVPGSTRLYMDGLLLHKGADFEETDPSGGLIRVYASVSGELTLCFTGTGTPNVSMPLLLPDASTDGTGLFLVPVTGPVTGTFGPQGSSVWGSAVWHGVYYPSFHNGVDFGVPTGTPVFAAAAGFVRYETQSAGGVMIHVYHSNGMRTTYAHLSQRMVADGATVSRGQHIAYSGATGFVTGAHLHWGLVYNGWPEDPMRYT